MENQELKWYQLPHIKPALSSPSLGGGGGGEDSPAPEGKRRLGLFLGNLEKAPFHLAQMLSASKAPNIKAGLDSRSIHKKRRPSNCTRTCAGRWYNCTHHKPAAEVNRVIVRYFHFLCAGHQDKPGLITKPQACPAQLTKVQGRLDFGPARACRCSLMQGKGFPTPACLPA